MIKKFNLIISHYRLMKTCSLCEKDQGHNHQKCKFCGHKKFGPRWIWVYALNSHRTKKIVQNDFY